MVFSGHGYKLARCYKPHSCPTKVDESSNNSDDESPFYDDTSCCKRRGDSCCKKNAVDQEALIPFSSKVNSFQQLVQNIPAIQDGFIMDQDLDFLDDNDVDDILEEINKISNSKNLNNYSNGMEGIQNNFPPECESGQKLNTFSEVLKKEPQEENPFDFNNEFDDLDYFNQDSFLMDIEDNFEPSISKYSSIPKPCISPVSATPVIEDTLNLPDISIVTIPNERITKANTKKRKRDDIESLVPVISNIILSTTVYNPQFVKSGFHAFRRSKISACGEDPSSGKISSFNDRNIFVTKSNESGYLFFMLDNLSSNLNSTAVLQLLSHDDTNSNSFDDIQEGASASSNKDDTLRYGIVQMAGKVNSLEGSVNLLHNFNDWHYIGRYKNFNRSRAVEDDYNTIDNLEVLASGVIKLPTKVGRFLIAIKPLKGLKNTSSKARAFQTIALRFEDGTVYTIPSYKVLYKDPYFNKK